VTFSVDITNVPTGDTSLYLAHTQTQSATAYTAAGSFLQPGLLSLPNGQLGTVPQDNSVILTLSSGTLASGIWTGSLTVVEGFSGTYNFESLKDGGSTFAFNAAQLAGAGLKNVTATATAVPTVSNVKGSWSGSKLNCSLAALILGICSATQATGTFTGTFSANALAVTVDSLTGGGCGGAAPGTVSSPAKNFTVGASGTTLALVVSPPGFGTCTVKLYVWNSAGRGTETTASRFFFG
jgi:hypothetical protein